LAARARGIARVRPRQLEEEEFGPHKEEIRFGAFHLLMRFLPLFLSAFLQSRAGQFPKPYPNGWYRVCGSGELKKGQVLAITCCGREMVAFRGADGRAGVLHAFCPHLGTHLGHGGTVQGNNLVCPYHSWEFDADGTNKCIPYCGKDMAGSKRVNARKYEVRERLDIIFV
jgi:nitrite reductase/ring-hydroxylating ferredoxin subunit